MEAHPEAAGVESRTPGKIEFRDPLPGDDAIWNESQLGPPAQWSESLQAFSLTIAAFPYPAAIFWGEQLIILKNDDWAKLSGTGEQGQPQNARLDSDARDGLMASLHGGKATRIRSHQLVRARNETHEAYTVLLSPLFEQQGSEDAVGVLAQLVPLSKPEDRDSQTKFRARNVKSTESIERESAVSSGFDEAVENVPLNEHPFFRRFAEMLPIGLAILDHKAQVIFVNQQFYELTTFGDGKDFKSWPESIHPEDYDRVMEGYKDAFRRQQRLRTEFRSVNDPFPWRLLLLMPLGDENLQHFLLRDSGGFICSIVDITSEKNVEMEQRKAKGEAQDRKDQQERFIDMISHEIRNPLSAILHCSEDIEAEIRREQAAVDTEAIREAVDTINICITHQRNIVDDVLSFSKLDASMLSLVPTACEPSRQLANSLKMFQPEFRRQSMKFEYCVDTSYVDLAIDWVLADLARIGQILVNLVTNAIKFTARSEGERKVVVSVGASRERPTSYPPNVVFFNSDDLAYRMDATNTCEWGNGETAFIMVSVKDTGIGISEEGQKRLFERFRQATPKTGEVYGGSGLGLNISRKLCHLHGGEIGVASQEGSGSTFGFFFKVKRAKPPHNDSKQFENEQKEEAEVKDQIDFQGLTSPAELDRSMIPESLRTPPVLHVNESARPGGYVDARYHQTARIASEVKEPEADVYAKLERPEISKEHKSGEHLQSEALISPHSGDPQPQKSCSNATHASSLRRRPIHVLLAEDNIINQRIVFRKLEKYGFNVTTANNGQEAVEGMRNAPRRSSGDKAAVDIVLMDQEMPVLDGNAATEEIRVLEQKGEVDHVPILGVTANVREDQQNEMIASGMDEVISKPYKIDELVQKINELLGSREET